MKELALKTACALLVLAATQASAVTLTFDDLANGAIVSNQYAALGAVFSPNAFTGINAADNNNWSAKTGMSVSTPDPVLLGLPGLASGKTLHSLDDWLAEDDGDPSFRVTFSTVVRYVSADFAGLQTTGSLSRIFAYNGSTLLGTVAAPDNTVILPFQKTLSFTSATLPITSIVITPGWIDEWTTIDNVTFAATAPVPEWGSGGLMALGLGLLAWRRRRV